MLTRREDWPERLQAFVVAAAQTPFAYGRHDCLLFATGAIEAMTGTDLAATARGTYDDAEGAAAALAAFAGGGVLEAAGKVAAEHGLERVGWTWAQRGDVVLVATPLGSALGICTGTHAMVAAQGGTGLAAVPMSRVARVYRIG